MRWAWAVVASSMAVSIELACTDFSASGSAPGGRDGGDAQSDASPDGSATPDGRADAPARTLRPAWVKTFGSNSLNGAVGGGTFQLNGTSFTTGGGIALTGTFDSPTSFGGPAVPGYVSKDVFLAVLDDSGNHVASKSYGGSYEQDGLAIVPDGTGGFWATLRFQGSITFDSAGKVDNVGSFNGAIAQMTQKSDTLEAVSATGVTGTGDIAVRRVSASSGSAVVFGDWTKQLKLGTNELLDSSEQHHLFVAQISAQLPVVRRLGDPADCTAGSSAVTANGDVVLTGRFMGTLDLGTAGEVVATSDDDAFVIRLDPQLGPRWVSSITGQGAQQGTVAVEIPGTNDVIVAGTFDGSLAKDDAGVSATAGGKDIFVARIKDTGAVVWTKVFGGDADDVVTDAAVDALGNVFLATHFFSRTIDFGGGALANADARGLGTTADVALVWLDAGDGSHVWSARYGTADHETTTGVGVTADRDVTLTGTFAGSTDLGTGVLPAKGKRDVFVARFTP